MKLHEIFRPLTATPFARGDSYSEWPPCEELKPYIRCFWGSGGRYTQETVDEERKGLITPDVCMDIIFDINYTENRILSRFCGINDQSFVTREDHEKTHVLSVFSIRFYAWSAVLFAEESMRDVKNVLWDLEVYFSRLKRELEPILFEVDTMEERIMAAEKYLLAHFHPEKGSRPGMDAVAGILHSRGNMRIDQLAKNVHTSTRQMERIFQEMMGITPKRFASLVRYQYLWNDVLFDRNFSVQDKIFELGYTDQAHLLRDFKHFHTMSFREARLLALKDVAFIQAKAEPVK